MAVERGSTTAWMLAAMAVGVVVAADPAGWSPFGPAKWAAVTITGVAACTAAAMAGASTHGALLTRAERLAIGGFLGCLLVASLNAFDGRYAWWGTPERHFGTITWLLIAAMYLAGRTLPTPAAQRVVARGLVLGGAGIAGVVAAELSGHPLVALAARSDRLTGPFGSSAYLGAAALLFGSASLGVALDRTERPGWRVAAVWAAVGSVVALFGSGSRGALLAAASVGVVVAVRRRRRRVLAGGVLLATIGLAVVVSTGLWSRPHGWDSRLDEWRVATRVVAAHPWSGTGPEGYRLAFAEGVDDRYEQRYGRDVLPDRAHAAPLDVAVTLGVPAAVLWLAATASVSRVLMRRLIRAGPTGVGLAAGGLAYLAQQLVLFPLAELDPLVWGVIGMLVASEVGVRGAATVVQRGGRGLRAGVAVAGAGAIVAASISGARTLAADRLAQQARSTGSIAVADRAVQLRSDVVRYHLLAARLREETGTLAGIDAARDQVRQALTISPLDPVVREERARLLSVRAGVTGSTADGALALAAWRSLVADDPHHADWQLGLGLAAAAVGDEQAAIAAWTRAAELAPRDPVAPRLLDELASAG